MRLSTDGVEIPSYPRAPLLYRLAKALERRRVKGSSWLLRSLRKMGLLDRAVDYEIGGALRLWVPLARNEFDHVYLKTYEREFLETLSGAIGGFHEDFTLIDAGADIGLFSVKLLSEAPSIRRIAAFEPNSEGFPWLRRNLARLPISAQAINSAVADFAGSGRLVAPARRFGAFEESHVEYFLVPDPAGPVNVTTIDSVAESLSGNLMIKLDIEGGEDAAIKGASKAIRSAPHVIVAFEAHPDVCVRTGVDPVECLRLLAAMRPFAFTVGETGATLATDTPVFEQIVPDRVYNLIAQSN